MAGRSPIHKGSSVPTVLAPLAVRSRIDSIRLSSPLTSFIGREQEIGQITGLLRDRAVRLLTLTGPGGIGKTRLALRVADEVSRDFCDGLAIISLAPLHEPALVPRSVAHVLGLPITSGQTATTRITSFLAEREFLLVIDNAEHLLDETAELVVALLTNCPHLKVLCTSRIRLGVSGEHLLPVDALSPHEARALFAERAGAVLPGFSVTTEAAGLVDDICSRLDGLPLAIELAAARIDVLPLPGMLSPPRARLDVLTGGPRDAPARQRSMRDTIAWSHTLLGEADQVLFRRLGVFAGGFTLDAAQAVAGEGGDALAGVSELVRSSLINPTEGVFSEPRFVMLETVREYAMEQLAASGEEEWTRDAHARHIVSQAEQIWTTDEWILGVQRLRPEIDNIRAALNWTFGRDTDETLRLSGSLMDFWILHGHYAEGRMWIERAFEMNSEAPTLYQVRAHLALGWLLMDQGDWVLAEVHLERAIAGARDLADEQLLHHCLMILGTVLMNRGDFDQSRAVFEGILSFFEGFGEPMHIAVVKLNLGRIATATGNLPLAQALLEESLAIHREDTGPIGMAYAQLGLGQVMLAKAAYPQALAYLLESLKEFSRWGDVSNVATALESLAEIAGTGHAVQAAHLLGAAAAIREQSARPPDGIDLPYQERTFEAVRAELGLSAFSREFDFGKGLDQNDVLAEVVALQIPGADGASNSLPAPTRAYDLSRRELEVLRLLVEGHSNRLIASTLSLSGRTVENHVLHILSKLGVDSRTAAATFAIRHGLA